MNKVKEIGPQMFVVSCINMDLVLFGVEEMNQFLHVFRERLFFCRWQKWHSQLRLAIILMFIGNFALFMIRKRN